MKNIIILEESIINKIAGGEVIERPASIVKELIENSIDAGAVQIFIEIKEGGKSYIKVSDNGYGMDENNAKLACLRHSTSKIKSVNDLFAINTLGFRGEALASIAAVSELTLITKQEQALHGTEVKVRAGKIISIKEAGCPNGTIIIVRHLFFNTPARKKYLKSIKQELSQITDIVQRYALINPEVHVKLIHNDNEILNCPHTLDMLTNLSHIYGRKVAKLLLEINHFESGIEISGFISRPEIARGYRTEQSIYVNKRYVRDKIIADALNDAYRTLLMKHKYPLAVLNITVDPSTIDVNVHPTKAEIRLEKPNLMYQIVFNAVKNALTKTNLIPERELAKKHVEKPLILKETQARYLDTSKQKPLTEINKYVELEKLPDMIVHGVVNKTYIIAETKNELLIIDQHAAAERILYEKFMEQYNNKQVSLQTLLEPLLLELNPKQAIVLANNLDFFKELGFQVEEFGKNSFIVRTIPSVFGMHIDKEIILELIHNLDSKKIKLDELKEEKIIKMACRAAVKAGDTVNLNEIRRYMQELDNRNIPFTCPHGRPVIIKLGFSQLEKMFKRKL
ncbi:DNA mismatch repair endonuclease MutL [Candidatus Woesearchaeota archaeon]|nr:DNA mismatch repair endonuclease MutL [Candidatus Woesearchaeota archaeon]